MVQRSLTSQLKKVQEDLDQVRDVFLQIVADDLVTSSIPTIDTGAYITSHSITTTRGAGRARSSHNKPSSSDPNFEVAQSLEQLYEDISALPKDQTTVYMTNNSPHASAVEYGGANWKEHPFGYDIYGSVRNRAKLHLEKAIAQVKGSP